MAAPAASSSDTPAHEPIPTASAPVEMDELQRREQQAPQQDDTTADALQDPQQPEPSEARDKATALPPSSEPQPTADATSDSSSPPVKPVPQRKQSEALGAASEGPITFSSSSTAATGPVLYITLMLTTGARHPYKIDERYLSNRKVEAVDAEGSFDPRDISGYKLKELIWTDWRAEWEPRPASPSAIRLIVLGRMVEDKMSLKDLPFKLDQPNVLHMTVKPADFLDDEEAAGKPAGKGHSIRGRDDGEGGAGCRCVIL